MRGVIFGCLLIAAGCAGTPSGPAPASAPPATKYVSDKPVVTAPDGVNKDDKDYLAKLTADAKRRGYTLVNQDGETLYCRKDAPTGSHLATQTICMTQKEMEDMRSDTQRMLQSTQMQQRPPSGH